ncbi:hypothetical protein [Devosia sp. DBB001]|nr:hypothetical protein [Devosia sp. DBB001]
MIIARPGAGNGGLGTFVAGRHAEHALVGMDDPIAVGIDDADPAVAHRLLVADELGEHAAVEIDAGKTHALAIRPPDHGGDGGEEAAIVEIGAGERGGVTRQGIEEPALEAIGFGEVELGPGHLAVIETAGDRGAEIAITQAVLGGHQHRIGSSRTILGGQRPDADGIGQLRKLLFEKGLVGLRTDGGVGEEGGKRLGNGDGGGRMLLENDMNGIGLGFGHIGHQLVGGSDIVLLGGLHHVDEAGTESECKHDRGGSNDRPPQLERRGFDEVRERHATVLVSKQTVSGLSQPYRSRVNAPSPGDSRYGNIT